MNEFSAIPKSYSIVAKLTGENFNIFRILGVGYSEIKHSMFLCELLNRNGSHGQGDVFLKLFVETFKIGDFDAIGDFNTEISTAVVEYHVGQKTDEEGGRIDIFIEDKNNCIIIENKIYAGDQENQILRYHNHAKKYGNSFLFYLTLWGDEPTERSTGGKVSADGKGYRCISYSIDIIKWLECCKKESVNYPILRESISQYINLLKFLTNQTIYHNMSNEIVTGIFSSEEKLSAYLNLINNSDVENKVFQRVFESFKLNLKKFAQERGLKFEFNVDRNKRYTGFCFENETTFKYDVRISFMFDEKNTQRLLFGFSYTKPVGAVSNPNDINEIIGEFENKFRKSNRTDAFPCYVWHEYMNWGNIPDIYLKVNNGEMAELIKKQVETMLEIIDSIGKNRVGQLYEGQM